jgi:hypothetical protein
MYMPCTSGYSYIIQACCSLLSYPEHQKLQKENESTIGAFIFEVILYHWGALEEIVTDNCSAFVEALNWLVEQYGIHHIHFSPYNSQANGIVEHRHLAVKEAMMKVCDREERKWLTAMHAVFWAERITTHKALGHSVYYIVDEVKLLLPFDFAEAMYMVPPQFAMTITELVALQARPLQKQPEDFDTIRDRVIKAHFTSICQFKKKYTTQSCKGTFIRFPTSPLLSYSPLVHMYVPHTFVLSPGTTPQSLMPFQMLTPCTSSTFCILLRSYLSHIGQASDTLGQVRVTLWYPPLSHGYPSMGGLVLGGLVL